MGNSLIIQSNSLAKDSLHANHLYNKAIQFNQKNALEDGNEAAAKAAAIFAKLGLWENWFQARSKVWYNFILLGNPQKTIALLENDFEQIVPEAEDEMTTARIIGWLGYTHNAIGNYKKALPYFLRELEILEALGNPGGKYGQLNSIANIYTRQRDYREAILYLDKAAIVHQANENYRALSDVYWNKGRVYWADGRFEKAIANYHKCLKMDGESIQLTMVLAEVYRDMGDLKTADKLIEKCLTQIQPASVELCSLYILKASIFSLKEDFENAVFFYEKALNQHSGFECFYPRELGVLHINIGNAYRKQDENEGALNHYQKALNELLPSFEEVKPNLNPSIESMDPANGIWIMEALIGKGKSFQKLYSQNKESDKLALAIHCYEKAFEVIDKMRFQYEETISKTELIGYAHPIYEQALIASLELFNRTGEESYLNQAFAFSQKTKAFLLASNLQNVNALKGGGVPDSLIEKENDLRNDILDLNLELSQQANLAAVSTTELEEKRFDAKRVLQKHLEYLKQNYPAYFQLKHKNKTVSIAEIRNQVLDKETAMIDFFLGESSLFILTISQGGADLQRLNRTIALDEAIQTFISEAGNYNFKQDPEKAFLDFTESAHFLFQQLLESSLSKLKKEVTQLIILPDGLLNVLPFEALLRMPAAQTSPNYSFENLAYLIEDYTISYHYSPQILIDQQSQNRSNLAADLFLGFAPSFNGNMLLNDVRDCSELGLSSLKYNQSEAETIAQLLKGEVYLGADASIQAFKERASTYRILHLATHACMSETDPLNHRIFFANEEHLAAHELFNMPLNAEMVVLSACETGLGKIIKGEGIMSLARGFAYAGSESVLMSLWSVSDKATSEIMVHFYENLESGLSKNESLRNAKLAFVKNEKSLKHHPYYWAAFTPIGKMDALFNDSFGLPFWCLFGGIGFLFVLLFSIAEKMKQKNLG